MKFCAKFNVTFEFTLYYRNCFNRSTLLNGNSVIFISLLSFCFTKRRNQSEIWKYEIKLKKHTVLSCVSYWSTDRKNILPRWDTCQTPCQSAKGPTKHYMHSQGSMLLWIPVGKNKIKVFYFFLIIFCRITTKRTASKIWMQTFVKACLV